MIHLDPKQEKWTMLKHTVEHMSKRMEVGQTATAVARLARVRSAFLVHNRKVQESPELVDKYRQSKAKKSGLFL